MAQTCGAVGIRVSRPASAKRKPIPKKALVRGEPVVQCVLKSTLEELAAVGYGALRIEDVATRAGVNKTTIYRRWPTKQELVACALRSVTTEWRLEPSTGSLREDMRAVGRHMVQKMSSVSEAGSSYRARPSPSMRLLT